MRKSTRFSPEVRERAVRMVAEQRGEHELQWAAIVSIAGKIGATTQTLLNWVLGAPARARHGPTEGTTTVEAKRIKELEREAKELRRANEILRLPSAFFA